MEAKMAELSNLVRENSTKKDHTQTNNQVRCLLKSSILYKSHFLKLLNFMILDPNVASLYACTTFEAILFLTCMSVVHLCLEIEFSHYRN